MHFTETEKTLLSDSSINLVIDAQQDRSKEQIHI